MICIMWHCIMYTILLLLHLTVKRKFFVVFKLDFFLILKYVIRCRCIWFRVHHILLWHLEVVCLNPGKILTVIYCLSPVASCTKLSNTSFKLAHHFWQCDKICVNTEIERFDKVDNCLICDWLTNLFAMYQNFIAYYCWILSHLFNN